ncbi:hypothetical protein F5Y04DRAFT_279582 [Hypomontagnella monticulosa]|nr:hypothetical protein F5Y04DRAFT_279582 [Hypomontagnella monticulosa]
MTDTEGPSCPIDGNSDLYGLGVRLGLYLQFIALVLARPSVKLAFKAINSSTIAFILANFIVLVRETTSRTLRAPEACLLFFLLVPQLAVNVISTDVINGSINLRGVVAILLWAAFVFYFNWFWWVGLDVLPMSGCEDEYGFFFTKVSLRGWFRTFNKVIWILADIGIGVVIIMIPIQILVLLGVKRFLKKQQEQQQNLRPGSPLSDFSDLDTERPRPAAQGPALKSEDFKLQNILQHISLQGWSLIPFAVFVTGAEVTLAYNNISGVNTVNSVSQLVPLVLALGLLVHVISKTIVKLVHGYRHAFDENATGRTGGAENDDHDPRRSEYRRELREETGWLGTIGRFLFRVYIAFDVGYNQDNEEEPVQSDSDPDCPKRGQYSAVDIELEGGARP